MTLNPESLQSQLPYYLTQDAKNGILKALQDFPEKMQYYTMLHQGEILQGDCWAEFEVIKFEDSSRRKVRGIILSNSCDIDPTNPRTLPPKISFAPIVKLTSYEKLLLTRGMTQQQVSDKFVAIRSQQVSNIFYLPKGGGLSDEHVVLLEDLHSMPFHIFESNAKKEKIFTLSMAGFYIFLFKLSFHFCRFHENIQR